MVFGIPEKPNELILHFIDFGLSKWFDQNDPGDEPPASAYEAKNLRLTGTPIYASVNSHLGWSNCYPKDDLESIVYICLHLLKGILPW